MCKWPALGMPWATARSNATCALVSRSGGASTGGCGTAVQLASGFVTFLSPSVMEPVLGNHCAQSPASVWAASPGHALGHCKVKCTLCSGQQVWWSLHWGLRHCCAGCLRGFFQFCHILESFSDAGPARQPLRTEPCQCVGVQAWACPGPLQCQMHPVQWSAGLVKPAPGAVLGCAGCLRGFFRFIHILESFSDGALLGNHCAQQRPASV